MIKRKYDHKKGVAKGAMLAFLVLCIEILLTYVQESGEPFFDMSVRAGLIGLLRYGLNYVKVTKDYDLP